MMYVHTCTCPSGMLLTDRAGPAASEMHRLVRGPLHIRIPSYSSGFHGGKIHTHGTCIHVKTQTHPYHVRCMYTCTCS